MHHARSPSVVVAAKKVVPRLRYHVGSRHGYVLVPGEVHATRVIHPIVKTARDRVLGHGSLRMVGHVRNIRRKERLVSVVDVDGNVGPPEEGLHEGGAVEKTNL